MRPRKKKARTGLGWTRRRVVVSGLLAVPLLVVVSFFVALRWAGPRQALLERFLPGIERSLNLAFEVGDFRLGVWSTSIELRDLSVAHPDGLPFLLGERARVSLSAGALATGRFVVRAIEADGLELDLERLEPERFATADEPGQSGASPFAADLDLGLGVVRGIPVPEALAPWITTWRLEGGRVRGTVEGGVLAVSADEVGLVLDRPGGTARAGRLSGRFDRSSTGDIDVSDLILAGRGVDVRAFGGLAGEAGGEQQWQVTFDLEPRAFFAVPAGSRGRLRGHGELSLPEIAARLELEALDVPAEIVQPWLDPELFATTAAETTINLTGELDVRDDRFETAAEVVWKGRGTKLLQAKLETPPEGTRLDEIRIGLKAGLLPGSPGRRELSGLLVKALGDATADFDVEDGEVLLMAPDVEELWADLSRHWPRLLPGDAPPQVTGALSARAAVYGPLLAPRLDVEAEWLPGGGTRVRMTARGEPTLPRLVGDLDILDLDPVLFGSPVGGSVVAAGSWRFGARGFATELEVSTRLATSERGLEAEGGLAAAFADGVVDLELSRLVVEGARGRIGARIPLTSLGPLMNEGPSTDRTVAPIRLDWELADDSTWHGLVEALTGEPAGFELVTGSRGDLEVDPRFPARSLGSVVFSATDLAAGSLRLQAVEELALVLENDALRIGPGRLNVGSETLRIEGELALDEIWRPDQPIAAAVRSVDIGLEAGVPLTSLVPDSEAAEVGGALDLRLAVTGALPWPDVDLDISSEDGYLSLGEGRDYTVSRPSVALRLRPGATTTLDARMAMSGGAPDSGSAQLKLRVPGHDPWRGGEASIHLERPLAGIDILELPLRVDGGALVSRGGTLVAAGTTSEIDLSLPLATLAGMLADVFGPVPLPAEAADGPFELGLTAGRQEWTRLLARLGVEEPPPLEAGLAASLAFDPAEPWRARGELVIEGLRAVVEGREIGSVGPIRLRLDESRLELEPSRLTVSGGGLELGGVIELAEGWRPEDSLAALVERLEGRASGEFPASLLNPFLGGGRAEGSLTVGVDVAGSVSTLEGQVRLQGPEATVSYIAPYTARFGSFDLDLSFRDGVAEIHKADLELNGGDVDLFGSVSLERGADLGASIDGARFRLDHGLITEISGELELTVLGGADRGVLKGVVEVDRGWLNRPIRLHSELLAQILSPFDLTGTEGTLLDQLDLDLELIQAEGVRVDNNLADLWVRWQPLEITGTAAAPVIDGRLDVDPGGLVFLFGQTVRLDRAILSYPGQLGVAPTLDLETTTSLEDPSIGGLDGLDPLTASSTPQLTPEQKGEALAAGVAGYYGEQIAGRIAETLGASRISVRPVLVFGEVDPSARLNIGRDFSSTITLAASVDLRNAERQTYLLDVHDIPGLPSFKGQVFTTDRGTEGTTAQQRLEFGGTPVTRVDGPRIRTIGNDPVPEISDRAIRRASGLTKGERLPDWGAFAAEIELESYLRSKGYPDARVEVTEGASSDDRVDLEIGIVAGPRVEYVFEGVPMARALRRTVSDLYRADFFEEASLLEMEHQAVLALRSVGYLSPRVEIDVESQAADSSVADSSATRSSASYDRRVTIASAAELRVTLEDLTLSGLPAAEAERVAGRFPSRLQRVELAAGLEPADQRLEKSLAGLGWPDATIAGRTVSEDGKRLVVEIEPGSRLVLGEVLVEMFEGAALPVDVDLAPPPELRPGTPLSSDLLARGALGLEGELRLLGYDAARVTVHLASGDETEASVDVTYRVVPGPLRRMGETRFAGLRSTRAGWAEARAALAAGEPLRQDDVLEARRRLYESGRFSSVISSSQAATDSAHTGEGPTEEQMDVVFDVRERSRFRLAYGLRWDSEQGGSVVLDLVDDSFLRRGLSLAGRALYSENDKSLRLNFAWPFLLFNKGTLEVFALARKELDEGLIFDTLESTIQLGYPVGRSQTVRAYTRFRDVQIYEEEPDPFFPIDVQIRNPFVGLQFIHDQRDEVQATTKGLFASADLSVSDDFMSSDVSYARFFGQVNLFRPAGSALGRRLTWAQSYRVGFAAAFKGQELRLEDRLYAGGEYSVRGYPRESLGPSNKRSPFLRVDEDALFVMNQELRFELWEPVAGLLFLDAGNTWTGTTGYDYELFKSVGFGLRALTPIGLLRLDLAYPLDRRDDDPAYKIYLGFGNVF